MAFSSANSACRELCDQTLPFHKISINTAHHNRRKELTAMIGQVLEMKRLKNRDSVPSSATLPANRWHCCIETGDDSFHCQLRGTVFSRYRSLTIANIALLDNHDNLYCPTRFYKVCLPSRKDHLLHHHWLNPPRSCRPHLQKVSEHSIGHSPCLHFPHRCS